MRLALGATVLVLALVGCGGADITATVVSTADTIGLGSQRILVEFRDSAGGPRVIDDAPTATLRDENGSPLGVYPGERVWVIPDEHAMYAFVVDIPAAETYQLTIDVGDPGEAGPAGFTTVEDPVQVVASEMAPQMDGAEEGPRLALFASLDWCPSNSCRPLADQVAAAVEGAPGVSWQLVEVFENPGADSEEDLVISPVVTEWGLPSQPWLYAIDASGTVVSVFEGAVSDTELQQAITDISE
jgi:hypothetical protein